MAETCQQIDEYLKRSLEPEQVIEFEMHLAQCARCQAELAIARSLDATIQSAWTPVRAPDELRERIGRLAISDSDRPPTAEDQKLPKDGQHTIPRRVAPRRSTKGWMIAAGLAVCLLLMLAVAQRFQATDSSVHQITSVIPDSGFPLDGDPKRDASSSSLILGLEPLVTVAPFDPTTNTISVVVPQNDPGFTIVNTYTAMKFAELGLERPENDENEID